VSTRHHTHNEISQAFLSIFEMKWPRWLRMTEQDWGRWVNRKFNSQRVKGTLKGFSHKHTAGDHSQAADHLSLPLREECEMQSQATKLLCSNFERSDKLVTAWEGHTCSFRTSNLDSDSRQFQGCQKGYYKFETQYWNFKLTNQNSPICWMGLVYSYSVLHIVDNQTVPSLS